MVVFRDMLDAERCETPYFHLPSICRRSESSSDTSERTSNAGRCVAYLFLQCLTGRSSDQ